MKKQVFRIDSDGYVIKVEHAYFDEQGNCLEKLDENVITIEPQDGLYKQKWTGTEWIEGLTQAEIEAINNVSKEPTEVEKLRLEQAKSNAELFEMMLMLTGGGL